jgi:hypothetical protein
MAPDDDKDRAIESLPEALYEMLEADGFFDHPPSALARLALSVQARELADRARSLVATTSDPYTGPTELIEHAASLARHAEWLLSRAVVHGRAQARSWEAIGEALDITRQAAHERFREAEEEWLAALDHPLERSGTDWQSTLPDGCDRPRRAAAELDEWCARHHEAHDGERPARAVSDGLINPKHLTVEQIAATTAQARRLVDRVRMDPVAHRVFWERKTRVLDRIAADRPHDSEAARLAAEAWARLNEIRFKGATR